jgi:hypothetical protein
LSESALLHLLESLIIIPTCLLGLKPTFDK